MKTAQTPPESKTSLLSYLTPVLSLFIGAKSAEHKEKIRRARTAFSTNRTASLAVPDTAWQKCEKVKFTAPPSTFSLSSIYTTLSSFFVKPVAPITIEEKKTECKPTRTQSKHIRNKMKNYETELKEHKSPVDIDKIMLKKVELVADQINEHAARRVDLFFYLLVAVYSKQVTISKDHTLKQHGKGSKPRGTQACHSSLFPNVKLEPIPSSWAWLFKPTPTKLAGTHLEDSLNMTVELPSVVNAFDQRLEGRYKHSQTIHSCLSILNRASKAEIDPKAGMNEFFKTMNDFFCRFENKYITTKTKLASKSIKTVWEYEKTGTFSSANADMTVNDEYLYLMLRLKPAEIAKVKKTPKLFQEFYTRMQDEILSSRRNTNHP